MLFVFRELVLAACSIFQKKKKNFSLCCARRLCDIAGKKKRTGKIGRGGGRGNAGNGNAVCFVGTCASFIIHNLPICLPGYMGVCPHPTTPKTLFRTFSNACIASKCL